MIGYKKISVRNIRQVIGESQDLGFEVRLEIRRTPANDAFEFWLLPVSGGTPVRELESRLFDAQWKPKTVKGVQAAYNLAKRYGFKPEQVRLA
ncbi:MAG: hypothetical protein LPH21_15975 [Shewanella sp.]|nr:hypothetical protein [Shewanella sp.]